jgi:hypothetical protein
MHCVQYDIYAIVSRGHPFQLSKSINLQSEVSQNIITQKIILHAQSLLFFPVRIGKFKLRSCAKRNVQFGNTICIRPDCLPQSGLSSLDSLNWNDISVFISHPGLKINSNSIILLPVIPGQIGQYYSRTFWAGTKYMKSEMDRNTSLPWPGRGRPPIRNVIGVSWVVLWNMLLKMQGDEICINTLNHCTNVSAARRLVVRIVRATNVIRAQYKVISKLKSGETPTSTTPVVNLATHCATC